MDQHPTVQAMLGDSLAAVAQASTVDLAARAPEAKDLIVVTEPAALVYGRGPRAVRLPPGRYLALTVDAGHVTGISATPHLQALTLEQTLAAAGQVGQGLGGATWRPLRAVSPDSVRAAARADDTGFFAHEVARWASGGDQVVMRVRQVADAGAPSGPPAASHRYLLSVEFENADVSRRFGEQAVETIARQQAGRAPE